jgi:hypothetical protein
MNADPTTTNPRIAAIEQRAREIDPMAWTAHALSTNDPDLRPALAKRRRASFEKARHEENTNV